MSGLPQVGESLDRASTLEAQSRRTRPDNHVCVSCKTFSLPRGWFANTGNCYWCENPRPTA